MELDNYTFLLNPQLFQKLSPRKMVNLNNCSKNFYDSMLKNLEVFYV